MLEDVNVPHEIKWILEGATRMSRLLKQRLK
jgi:hypothetical protein